MESKPRPVSLREKERKLRTKISMRERKNPWDVINLDAEEVLVLSAGDDEGNAVGEPHDHGARNEFHGRAETSHTEQYEDDPRHDRAHIQAIESVASDDAEYDHNKCACGPTYLSAGPAQNRNQESGNDCAIQARLVRETRGNRKGHRQRQRNKADSDSSQNIGEKFPAVVAAQALNRFVGANPSWKFSGHS